MTTKTSAHYERDEHRLTLQGDWDLVHYPQLQHLFEKISWKKADEVIFDGKHIKHMDSAGAFLIVNWQNKLIQDGHGVKLEYFSSEHQMLIDLITNELPKEIKPVKPKKINWVTNLGKKVVDQVNHFLAYLAFVGNLTMETLRVIMKPRHLRLSTFASVIYQNGYQALAIIAVLSFMIGVVIAYQMGVQLRTYGANVYIVDFLGLAVLREFGPLLTAIMVAGRTGSSFTAQLGLMKINQEIDALDTMGVTPAELLILPRIIGLFIALPLLTMWANIFGIMGGMIMANNMLHISSHDFLHRFGQVIPYRALIIGLGKAPIFALIIASVGCFQGMQVKGSAESVGHNTTRSVVLAIFFIIVVDAIFSIVFSKLKL
jgi:phospholipid/cholesterol/gamma-HCH transport system permease protein